MKKFTLTLIVTATCLFSNNNELTWVDEQIEAIKPPRVGLSPKEINQLKDPFILLVEKKEDKKTVAKKEKKHSRYNYTKKVHKRSYHFSLEAIMNKSALINGKWYKEGTYIYGYKITNVDRNKVILTKGSKKITLSTISKKKNLKFNKK
ncbi:MAG: hypothetical protein ABGW85_04270 [Sulfurimonas sp.]